MPERTAPDAFRPPADHRHGDTDPQTVFERFNMNVRRHRFDGFGYDLIYQPHHWRLAGKIFQTVGVIFGDFEPVRSGSVLQIVKDRGDPVQIQVQSARRPRRIPAGRWHSPPRPQRRD